MALNHDLECGAANLSSVKDGKKFRLDTDTTQKRLHEYPIRFTNTGVRLGITWNNLEVLQAYTGTSSSKTVISQLYLRNIIQQVRAPKQWETVIESSRGCVKPGEMLLVLGQPAACTALLSVLADRHKNYSLGTGEVWYGSMKPKDVRKFAGATAMADYTTSFPQNLTINQILEFVLGSRGPRWTSSDTPSRKAWNGQMRDYLIDAMGLRSPGADGSCPIENLPDYKESLLSLAETIAMQPSILCWDDYSRGLDSRRVFSCIQVLRELTNALGLSSIACLGQASNPTFDMFDKVLVLDGAKQVFFGPTQEARRYLQSLITTDTKSTNTVAALTDFRSTLTQAALIGCNSRTLALEDQSWEEGYRSRIEVQKNTAQFFQTAKSKRPLRELRNGFLAQFRARSMRRWQALRGHLRAAVTKQFSTLIQALTCGTLMIDAPRDSSGFSIITGALFFSVLFHSLMALSEIPDFFSARSNVLKYNSNGFFKPMAVMLEQTLYDLSSVFIQITVFALPFYFLVGLTSTVSAFSIYWFILFSKSMALVALFRFVAVICSSINTATIVSGLISNTMISYCGYVVSHPNMEVWFAWLFWINPDAWAYEALADNEFHGKLIACVGSNLIPSGAGYTDPNHQSCSGVSGAIHGKAHLTGDQYLHSQGYRLSRQWSNVGLMWAVWLLFSLATVVVLHRYSSFCGNEPSVKDSRHPSSRIGLTSYDLEARGDSLEPSIPTVYETSNTDLNNSTTTAMKNCQDFIAWKNLTYLDPSGDGSKGFQDVSAWLRPGTLTAAFGSSGSSLLNVLAQRVPRAQVRGCILVNGVPASIDFKRLIGYSQKVIRVEPHTTVKDALFFSATLRLGSNVPRAEKLTWVETVINCAGLQSVAQCCITMIEDFANLELKRRVSLAIELVARPSLLLLDDFTCDLNREQSIRILQLLRKIADAGQTILIAINQPHRELFPSIDAALVINEHGKTVYFGLAGSQTSLIEAYLELHGESLSQVLDFERDSDGSATKAPLQNPTYDTMWQTSAVRKVATYKLEQLLAQSKRQPVSDTALSSPSLWDQTKAAIARMSSARFRNTQYANNAVILHIALGLFNGFSYFQLGDSVIAQGLRQSTIFNFIFVAPGIVAQLQPHFLDAWHLYTSEGGLFSSTAHGWIPVVTGLILTEIPYIAICTFFYFVTWYFTAGLPLESSRAGAMFFTMFAYALVYTSMGQLIAACSPTITYAAFFNPLVLGNFVAFAGILVPYTSIPAFWRGWAYWANPFTYMVGSLFIASSWGREITCTVEELAVFDHPAGSTCAEYLRAYQQIPQGSGTRLLNPQATTSCQVCPFQTGADWLHTRNYQNYSDGWRYAGITVLFALGYYALIYVVCMLRYYKERKTAKK